MLTSRFQATNSGIAFARAAEVRTELEAKMLLPGGLGTVGHRLRAGVTNRLGFQIADDPREKAVRDALYRCLERADRRNVAERTTLRTVR